MSSTVRYGAHRDQVAEVTAPVRQTGRAPLVLLLHGGFWRAEHDRAHVAPLADDLASRGYVVADVEYRRTGAGGGWPTTFTDVAAAVNALPAMIDRAWPGLVDESRLAYLGHSAGGHLALWAALRDQLSAGTPGWTQAAPRVRGVVALAPVSDLAEAYRQGEGRRAVAELLGGGPEDVPDRYAAANPMQLGAPRAPVVLIHGDRDQAVPVAMSRRYQLASGAQLLELPGADHFELIDHRSAAWGSIVGVLRRLLE